MTPNIASDSQLRSYTSTTHINNAPGQSTHYSANSYDGCRSAADSWTDTVKTQSRSSPVEIELPPEDQQVTLDIAKHSDPSPTSTHGSSSLIRNREKSVQGYQCLLHLHNPNIYSHPKCRKRYHSLAILRRHIKTHSPPHYCKNCHYQNANKKRFNEHYNKGQCKPEENKLRYPKLTAGQQENFAMLGVKGISFDMMRKAILPCVDKRCKKCWPTAHSEAQGMSPNALGEQYPDAFIPDMMEFVYGDQASVSEHVGKSSRIRIEEQELAIIPISRSPEPRSTTLPNSHFHDTFSAPSTSVVPKLTLTIPGEGDSLGDLNQRSDCVPHVSISCEGNPNFPEDSANISTSPNTEHWNELFMSGYFQLTHVEAEDSTSPRTFLLAEQTSSTFDSRSEVSTTSPISCTFVPSSCSPSSASPELSPRNSRASFDFICDDSTGIGTRRRSRSETNLSSLKSNSNYGQFLLPPASESSRTIRTNSSESKSGQNDRPHPCSNYRCPIFECYCTFRNKSDLCMHLSVHGFHITITRGASSNRAASPP